MTWKLVVVVLKKAGELLTKYIQNGQLGIGFEIKNEI